jgi:hypothetical protein
MVPLQTVVHQGPGGASPSPQSLHLEVPEQEESVSTITSRNESSNNRPPSTLETKGAHELSETGPQSLSDRLPDKTSTKTNQLNFTATQQLRSPMSKKDVSETTILPVNSHSVSKTSKQWAPFTLQWVFLLCFLIFQLSIIVAISGLQMASTRYTGLTTITQEDSVTKQFIWSYLPTGIALIVGILWAATDLNVVRTEPYVRLSEESGASFDVIIDRCLYNPFTAIARIIKSLSPPRTPNKPRYSSIVFISVLAHILSMLAIAPLQSSLMSVIPYTLTSIPHPELFRQGSALLLLLIQPLQLDVDHLLLVALVSRQAPSHSSLLQP